MKQRSEGKMLEVGTMAPDFTLLNQNGEEISLSQYRGQKVILYFYPKDNTPGCTKQACGFAQLYPDFNEKGAVILGVSKDSVKSHKKFQEKYQLPSLEQVLQLKSDKIFLLEVKESDIDVLKFQELIHRYPTKNIYVMSFSNKVISRFINGKQHEKLGVLNYVLNSEEDYQEYDFICLLESVVSSKLLFFFESLHMETFIYGIHHFAKTKEEYKTAYLITDEVI